MPEVSETAGNLTPEVPVQTNEVSVLSLNAINVLIVLYKYNSTYFNYLNINFIFFLDERGEKPIFASTT